MDMNKLFLSHQAKIAVDILMFLTLILVGAFSHVHDISDNPWQSAHCVIGLIWLLFMLVHTAQNWKFIKLLKKKKVMQRNKITTLVTVSFILTMVSVLLLTGGFNFVVLKFHGLFGRLLTFFVIIHIIYKFRRFLALFKKNKKE